MVIKKIGDFEKKMYGIVKKSSRTSLCVFIVLRILVILCLIREIMNNNLENALLCMLSLILFFIPFIVEKKFKISFPTVLEVIVLLFIFASEILGEINNFYGLFHNFDDLLHVLNGFLAASIGFSLVYLLNKNSESFKLSPFFVSLVAFCFSMTIGILWEFFEYGMDNVLKFDMQKDEIIHTIRTVKLDLQQDNKVINIDGIDHSILYDKNNNSLFVLDGYLDIGLHDTMNDLIVNFIGAFVFCVFGYLYIINKDKYRFAGNFITKKLNE